MASCCFVRPQGASYAAMTDSVRPFKTSRLTLSLIVVTLAAILAGYLALPRLERFFAERAQVESTATLRIVADGLNQTIGRYDPLPELLAERQSLVHVLKEPGNAGLIPFVNEQLRQSALSVGASDIFLMDQDGLTIAASNYRSERPFVGENFEFRPYFQQAIAGQSAQFHALGTTSGERGFFFASPVLEGISVKGVIALKVTVDELEKGWEGLGREIAIADPNGIIFLTSREEWRFKSLGRLSADVKSRIAETRQFPMDRVSTLDAVTQVDEQGNVQIAIDGPDGTNAFHVESTPLALAGWHATVFSPMTPIRSNALSMFLIWTLGVLVLALLSFVALQRWFRRAERMRIQRQERQLLERRVQERTADLNKANAELQSEVEERKATEARLKKTQKDLVQAGKLAALGQMSAALSHEINQPLSAVISYADNAATFLERDRVDDAKDNITRISQMADRMARISRHLRNFARRPGDKLSAVPVSAVIDEAMSLTAPQLNSRGAKIDFIRPEAEHFAIGGQLRLQQVLVNIFSNALDAMVGVENPVIRVSMSQTDDEIQIDVRDYGHGFQEGALNQAFDPFYSTKEGGEGMGLGLSISYNIVEDFGGRLTAQNHQDGGAVFGITLRKAVEETMVAE